MTGSTSERASDRVVLTLPADDQLFDVATLVLGGIGSRLDLPYEKLDNLQLAVVSVLSASGADTVTVDIAIEEDAIAVKVEPVPAANASDEGRRRVLARLVDAVEAGVDDSSGAGGSITLRLARPAPAP